MTTSSTDVQPAADSRRKTWRQRLGLPWFAPSSTPYEVPNVHVDEHTTPRQLLIRTIWSPRRFVLPGGLLAALHQLGEALVPVLAGLAIDNAIRGADGGALMLWLGLLALDFMMLSVSFRFGSRIGFVGMHAVRQQLRVRVARRLLDPRGSADGDRLPGIAMSLASSDVDRLTMSVAIGIYPLGHLVGVTFGAVVLLSISWPLGLGVLLGVPLLLVLLDRAGEPLRRRSGTEQQMAAAAAGRAADLMSGYRIIKGVRGERHAQERYIVASRDSLTATLQARRAFGGYLGLVNALTGLFIAAIGTAAGWLTVTGRLSIAELVTVAGLAQYLIGPIQALSANFGTSWARGLASAERVLTVLRDEPRHVGALEVPTGDEPATVEIEGLGRRIVVAPGELVVVRAGTEQAAGLFRALAGDDAAIKVEYGGIDVRRIDPMHYRSAVLAAPHDARLFGGGVLENVTLGRVDEQSGLEALRAAGYAEVLLDPSDAAGKQVGNGGELLSGGQRQRVALARAIAQAPPVLVVLDPTTAVDSVTESLIAAELREVRGGRTTIVISDSPAFGAVADRVVQFRSEK